MDTELIPPNLHYNKPRQGAGALESGRIKVVTEVTPFKAKHGLISKRSFLSIRSRVQYFSFQGISSFGFGGANGHCVLKWNEKRKKLNGLPEDELPRLVCLSGRTPQSLTSLMSDLRNRTLDAEYVGLLHKIFRYFCCYILFVVWYILCADPRSQKLLSFYMGIITFMGEFHKSIT